MPGFLPRRKPPCLLGKRPCSRRRPGGRRIGLLGGSFNPAHEGHRAISLHALKVLGLDEVWWLVSPQNPLKPADGMAPFAERFASAAAAANHPRIRPSDIEHQFGTSYTAETVARLRRRFPQHDFVWLMGADNLLQIDRWKDWQQIFHCLPVAVFARPTYSARVLAAMAARRFARARLPETAARGLVGTTPPAWVFLRGPHNPVSATAIRAARSQKSALKRGRPR